MNTEASLREFCGAARNSIDDVFAKHLGETECESTLFRLNHCMALKCIELRALYKLVSEARHHLDRIKRYYKSVQDDYHRKTANSHPQCTLPAELIHYIISIAYDDEISEDPNDALPVVGARSLVTETTWFPENRRSHKYLLSATTHRMNISSIHLPFQKKQIGHTDPLKLRIRLPSWDFMMKGTPEVVSQNLSRINSVTMYRCSQLNDCMSILPSLEDFKYLPVKAENSEADWNELQQVIENSKHISLRSSTLPSCFLARFASTGFLQNVTSLHVYVGFDGVGSYQWPPLRLYVDVLLQLPSLNSLKLEDIYDLDGCQLDMDEERRIAFYNERTAFLNASDKTCRCRRLAPLRHLHLVTRDWLHAESWFLKFHTCDLTEIFLEGMHGRFGAGVGKLTNILCDTFPNLKKLQIPTLDICNVLRISPEEGGHPWKFPNLDTLIIRDPPYEKAVDMNKWIKLFRDRMNPKSRSLGIQPINCFILDASKAFSKAHSLFKEEERALAGYMFEQLIPNLVWRVASDGREH